MSAATSAPRVPHTGPPAGPCGRRTGTRTGTRTGATGTRTGARALTPAALPFLTPLLAPLLIPVLVLLLAVVAAPLAATPAQAAAPLPAAASSLETGELHQDTPEATLRLPTGHPTRLPRDPRPAPYAREAVGTGAAAHRTPPSPRAPRSVVLRC
ncbi:hypothetical protein [Streptomyces sp. NPDC046939]|uniref:hypothetical protein n=1 Tax=Streptomyces sp. NPDC046939 TaxID=3155376 RepID=UPI0033E23E44